MEHSIIALEKEFDLTIVNISRTKTYWVIQLSNKEFVRVKITKKGYIPKKDDTIRVYTIRNRRIEAFWMKADGKLINSGSRLGQEELRVYS